ncbi:MAG: response regulator, partial [Sphingomonas bacterium]|nr:response regulator [Sphingomonas bacterium]
MREEVLRSLLLVDADAAERRHLTAIASRAGWSVVGAADAETALGLLQGPHGRDVRAAVLTIWDDEQGPALIAAMRREAADLPILVLADGGSIALAVEAMRAGATDYLARPVAAERMLDALAAHADRRRGHGELAPLSEKHAPDLPLDQLVGSSSEFRAA